MQNNSSLFIFGKDGAFLDIIGPRDDLKTHPVVESFSTKELSLLREKKEEGPNGGGRYIFYAEIQNPGDEGYLEALGAELLKMDYHTYLFDEEKSEVAKLLLSAKLEGKENMEFFDKLFAADRSVLPGLKSGIKHDLAQRS